MIGILAGICKASAGWIVENIVNNIKQAAYPEFPLILILKIKWKKNIYVLLLLSIVGKAGEKRLFRFVHVHLTGEILYEVRRKHTDEIFVSFLKFPRVLS